MDEATMATGGAAPEAGTEQQATQQAAAVDLAPIFDRMDELSGAVKDLGARIPQPETPPEPGLTDGWDPEGLFGDPAEPDGESVRRTLADLVSRGASQEAQKLVAPLMQRLDNYEVEQSAERLERQFPRLKEPEVLKAVFDQASGVAAGIARSLNLDEAGAQRLLRSPELIETAYKAWEAEQRANGETPADPTVNELESAGGASPGGPGGSKSIIDEVLEGRRGLPSWAY